MMNRRNFCLSSVSAAALLRSSLGVAQGTPESLALQVHTEEVGRISPDMIGLSYESTQLGDASFFAAANKTLVSLFHTLSSRGVLRLGGNTSEFTYFAAGSNTAAPPWSPRPTQPAKLTPITPLALRNLREFLEATDWDCIYGLNLGTGTPARAAQEAVAVTEALGPRLKYLQIGNEPNNYIRYLLRPDTWNERTYYNEWSTFAQAILQRLPNAKLGGPDMGADRPWMQLMATEGVRDFGANLVEITDHFYAEGPPSSPASTIDNLLNNTKINHEIDVMVEAGATSHLPYRMTEVNSCYSGGKPLVSDTLASALWAAELTLRLASLGFCGVNFHGGSAKLIKASLGGQLPGDDIASKEANDSYYTPIGGDAANGYTAKPIFYGMLFASQVCNTTLLRTSFSKPQETISAYAMKSAGHESMQVALFNKGAVDVEIALSAGPSNRKAVVQRLRGPSITAITDVKFGGATVDETGNWKPKEVEKLAVARDGHMRIAVPRSSAALIHLS